MSPFLIAENVEFGEKIRILKMASPQLTVISNHSPTRQKCNKNEQTNHIGAGSFRQWSLKIFIVLEWFTYK